MLRQRIVGSCNVAPGPTTGGKDDRSEQKRSQDLSSKGGRRVIRGILYAFGQFKQTAPPILGTAIAGRAAASEASQ